MNVYVLTSDEHEFRDFIQTHQSHSGDSSGVKFVRLNGSIDYIRGMRGLVVATPSWIKRGKYSLDFISYLDSLIESGLVTFLDIGVYTRRFRNILLKEV